MTASQLSVVERVGTDMSNQIFRIVEQRIKVSENISYIEREEQDRKFSVDRVGW